MVLLVGVLLALGSIVILALPFLRAQRERGSGPLDTSPEEFLLRRQNIYEEIHTLQLDHEIGNIGDEEYQRQLHLYRLEAAMSLKEEEVAEEDIEELERALEDEILSLRKPQQSSGDSPGMDKGDDESTRGRGAPP